jgi:hypothetical protein
VNSFAPARRNFGIHNRLDPPAAPVMIKFSHGSIKHSEHFVGLHLKLA